MVAVLTGRDLLDDIGIITTSMERPEVRDASRRALPTDKVRHVGDPVAVVIAKSRYAAEDGVDAVDVAWEPLPPVADPEKSMAPDAPRIDESLDDNNIGHIEGSFGDVEAAKSLQAGTHVEIGVFVDQEKIGIEAANGLQE